MTTATEQLEANKKLARDYIDQVFNQHNPGKAADFVTSDVVWHGNSLGDVAGSENLAGLLGSFIGAPADGKPVRWNAIDIYRITDGKISEEWAADDVATIMTQVGVFTPPWAA